MKKSDLKAFIKEEILNEMALQEMATFYKIKGDKEEAKKAISKEKEKYREGTTLYNTLDTLEKKGEIDYIKLAKELGKDTATFNNPKSRKVLEKDLEQFIEPVKSKKGPKADPNKPKSLTGKRGRPSKSKEEKDKESKRVSSKLSRSVTTVKGDEPSAKDIKQAIGSTGISKRAKKDLKAQEKRKMVKAFIKDMQDKGILSSNNKIEDKEKYDAAWAVEKKKIETALKQVKEASSEEVTNQKELNKELEKTADLKKQAGLTEENIGLADLEEMGYEAGENAFDMHFDINLLKNRPDMQSYKKGFIQAIIDSAENLRYKGDINETKKK